MTKQIKDRFAGMFAQPAKFNDVVVCSTCGTKQVKTFDPDSKRAQFYSCTKCESTERYYPSNSVEND